MTNNEAAYQRVVLKFSGEALSPSGGNLGIDPDRAEDIAVKTKKVYDMGVQIAIVCGAGNLWRGSMGVERGMEQSTADHMGVTHHTLGTGAAVELKLDIPQRRYRPMSAHFLALE